MAAPSPMSQKTVVSLVKDQLWPGWIGERDRLDRIDRWYRWKQEDIKLPRTANPELRQLAALSKTPWLGLVVTSTAQCMYADGYRSALDPVGSALTADEQPAGPWRTWLGNDFDHRQIAIHRAALAYGYTYARVLPGEGADGRPMSVMRGVSPRKMWAVYEDPGEDDWPMYAMQVNDQPDKSYSVSVYDDHFEYILSVDSVGATVEFVEWRLHNAGVCPVVRYCNMLDLDGRSAGEVEPFIPAAARINKTAFDRLMTQHFSSWKIRTVAGMSKPTTEEEQNRAKLKLRQDDVLIAADKDTKFGTLDETPLEGFIAAWRSDIEALAAVSQTPAHELTGQLVNLSAEALAAARSALSQKVFERKKAFGKAHAQALRLAMALEGDEAYAADLTGRVTWQDTEIRSLSQAVDALGKAATMLQVPVEALWSRIPGVEKSDVDEWREMNLQADPITRMQQELERQATGPAGNG